ncbi:phage portal protein, partial [Xanthomonas arboricola]
MLTDQLPATAPAAPAVPARTEAFTFGDPTPVLDGRGVLDYLECWQNGRWYEPPVALDGLSKTTRSNPFLQSGLIFKRNMLARTFKPHRLLTREAFEQLSLDWITLGNGYLERHRNRMGGALSLAAPLSKYMRRGITEGEYFQVHTWHDEHVFEPGSVFQLREADVDQELYGLPEWMPAMQSALLNESATLF